MEQPILTALYPAHAADLKVLLETFYKAKTLEFKQFRDIWKEMLFSTIHQGKATEGENQLDYVQSLFVTALGFFQLNHSFEVRIGVLYALYLLYETQPTANTSSHKYKINVSLALWNDFQRLYEEIKQRKLVDAYAIFRKMQRERFFSIHAVLRSTPSSTNSIGEKNRAFDDLTTDTIRNADTLTGVLDIEALERTESAYENSEAYQNVFNANTAADSGSRPLSAELREVMVRHERTKYLRVTQQLPVPERSRKKARSRKWPKGENIEAVGTTPGSAASISGNKIEDQTSLVAVTVSTAISDGPFEDMPDLGTSVDQIQMIETVSAINALIPPRATEEPLWEATVASCAATAASLVEKEKEKPEKQIDGPPQILVATPPPPRRKAQPKQRAISTAVSGTATSASPPTVETELPSKRRRSTSSAATSRSSASRSGSRRNYHSVSTVYTYDDDAEKQQNNTNPITETPKKKEEAPQVTSVTGAAEVTPLTPPVVTGTLLDLISPSPTKATASQHKEVLEVSLSLQPTRSTRKHMAALRSSKEPAGEADA